LLAKMALLRPATRTTLLAPRILAVRFRAKLKLRHGLSPSTGRL